MHPLAIAAGLGDRLVTGVFPGPLPARRPSTPWRRAHMLLPPMDVYEQLMTSMYHKKLLPGVAEPEPTALAK
jgi:hypothetical protein